MNYLFVTVTALTVSIDSFIAGFSLSLDKKESLSLPLTVAAVTYLMCLIASLAGIWLQDILTPCVNIVGPSIMVILGVLALMKNDEPTVTEISSAKCLIIAFGVGADGAVAALSLSLQQIGDVYLTPLLFAVTHFAAVFAGQRLAQKFQIRHANVLSAVLFFALATLKLSGI